MTDITTTKESLEDPSGYVSTLERDAERYRKLRRIAIKRGELEAKVAMAQLDFISDYEKFDTTVDSL